MNLFLELYSKKINLHAKIKHEYKWNSASFSKFLPSLSLFETFNILFCCFRSPLPTSIVKNKFVIIVNTYFTVFLWFWLGKLQLLLWVLRTSNSSARHLRLKNLLIIRDEQFSKAIANKSASDSDVYNVSTHPEIVNRGNTYYSLPGFSVNTLWECI